MTHIEQFTVTQDTTVIVNLVDSGYSVSTTDITFNAWDDATYQSTTVSQFDHGARYRDEMYGLFTTGIIRYDADRIFGNGDGTLTTGEADLYENFLENTIGPDGETTRNAFKVGSYDYTYSAYTVAFGEGSSDVRSTDTVQLDYTCNLASSIGSATTYKVYYILDARFPAVNDYHFENVTFNLPDGYEVTYERLSSKHVVSHAEDDTTIVHIDGLSDAQFWAEENQLPNPDIEVTEDFVPGDDMYLFRSNEYIEFNGSQSNDGGSVFGKILTFGWTFDNVTGGNVNNTEAAVRMFDEGTYTATLKVTDNAGGAEVTSVYFVVDDTAPDVDFSVEPAMADQGTSENDNTRVYLNITTLNDLNGIYDQFNWDLGNGIFTNVTNFDDRNITYYYNTLDIAMLTGVSNQYSYTITLTVWDDAGNENTATHTILVNNTRRPDAQFEISDDLVQNDGYFVFNTNDPITFNASDSETVSGEIISYSFDFDDGTPDSAEMVVNHSYATAGMYDVVLTVQDENGGSDTYNVTIYIDDAAPTATFEFLPGAAWYDNVNDWWFIDQKNDTATQSEEQYLLNLSANGTVDNGDIGDILGLYNFTWSFEELGKPGIQEVVGDNFGNSEQHYIFTIINNSAMNVTIENVTYYYYTVTFTVWDRAGNSDSFQRNIIVNDTKAPEAKFTYNDEIDQGTSMELNATDSEDNIGIVAYDWIIQNPNGSIDYDVGLNGGMIFDYVFEDNGDYTVTLNVTDGNGNKDSHISTIIVNRIPQPDLAVSSDGIFYSKESITEGDTIDILVNLTNYGDKEAWNATVKFWFRKNLDTPEDQWEEIKMDFVFLDPIIPTDIRIANASYKVKESGQIVVRVSIEEKDPAGLDQEDSNPDNNEAFLNIYAESDGGSTNRGLVIGVVAIVLIIAIVAVIFFTKPELMGINPAPSGKKSRKK